MAQRYLGVKDGITTELRPITVPQRPFQLSIENYIEYNNPSANRMCTTIFAGTVSNVSWAIRMDRYRDTGRLIFSIFLQIEDICRSWCPKTMALLASHSLFKAYFRRFHMKGVGMACDCGEKDAIAAHALDEYFLPRRSVTKEVSSRSQEERQTPYLLTISTYRRGEKMVVRVIGMLKSEKEENFTTDANSMNVLKSYMLNLI